MTEVISVRFRGGCKSYFFDPGQLDVHTGDELILDTTHGLEFAQCVRGNHTVTQREVVAPLRPVLRIANAQDEKTAAENQAREKRAFEICQEKIQEHGLDMQMVSAECAFDGSKLLFFFTADERVDFRDLVKDLAGIFHTRIELRQIGYLRKTLLLRQLFGRFPAGVH